MPDLYLTFVRDDLAGAADETLVTDLAATDVRIIGAALRGPDGAYLAGLDSDGCWVDQDARRWTDIAFTEKDLSALPPDAEFAQPALTVERLSRAMAVVGEMAGRGIVAHPTREEAEEHWEAYRDDAEALFAALRSTPAAPKEDDRG